MGNVKNSNAIDRANPGCSCHGGDRLYSQQCETSRKPAKIAQLGSNDLPKSLFLVTHTVPRAYLELVAVHVIVLVDTSGLSTCSYGHIPFLLSSLHALYDYE